MCTTHPSGRSNSLEMLQIRWRHYSYLLHDSCLFSITIGQFLVTWAYMHIIIFLCIDVQYNNSVAQLDNASHMINHVPLGFVKYITSYSTLGNYIALGFTSCNIIFQSAIKRDIALTPIPYLYNIVVEYTKIHVNHLRKWSMSICEQNVQTTNDGTHYDNSSGALQASR